MAVAQTGYMYPQFETFGKEFSVLSCVCYFSPRVCSVELVCVRCIPSDFLDTLDEQAFFNPSTAVAPSSLVSGAPYGNPDLDAVAPTLQSQLDAQSSQQNQIQDASAQQTQTTPQQQQQQLQQSPQQQSSPIQDQTVVNLFSGTSMAEKFLLTAADQEPGSRDERLKRVIKTKYEAGLLKPYNYVKGYARLSRWMDRKCALWSLSGTGTSCLTIDPHCFTLPMCLCTACPRIQNNRFCSHYPC